MPTWSDAQYLKFADERTRPARELLDRVQLQGPRRLVDLGCGPGNSTALLRERWPEAHLLGVDDSSEMLARARADHPTIDFAEVDIAAFGSEETFDLVFANAAFHWLPDHRALLARLTGIVGPGGTLAFAVPCNFDQPSHRFMREPSPSWAGRFDDVTTGDHILSAWEYYDVLAPRFAEVDIWKTTYEHVMPSVHQIVAWVRGTGLRPFLESLSRADQEAYLEAYACALDSAYPPRVDGKRLFSFTRMFVVARGA